MAVRAFGRFLLSFMLVVGLCPATALAVDASDEAPQAASSASGSSDDGTLADGAVGATDGEILVVYDNTSWSLPVSQVLLAASGAGEQETVAELADGGQTVVKVQVDEAKVDDLIDGLNASPDVVWAQRNFEYELTDVTTDETDADEADAAALDSTDDPDLDQQYYVGDWDEAHGASVEDAWSLVQTDQSVTVAVLDTGARITHEDLKANLDTDHMIDLTSDAPTAGVISDVVGHGTHVAGIIAAQANNALGVAGVSYNAKVLPIQIFYKKGTSYKTNTEYMLKAFTYLDGLVENGELTDLHVINMSFGGYDALSTEDYAFEAAIKEMRDEHNVLSVAAGGNGNSKDTPKTGFIMPGDFDECLSVTVLNKDGTDVVWSDYNQYKDISAPGMDILSTTYASDASYGTLSGTSMAAPVVSGVAALLWAAEPNLTVDQAVTALEETANPVVEGAYYRGSDTGSAGCVDAAAAVQYVKEHFAYMTTKEDLASLLEQCDDLAESTYTEESWDDLAKARQTAQAVYDDDEATAQQIDDAYQELLEAKNALVSWFHQFSDVSYDESNWQVPGINYVARFGVMSGYSGTNLFGPDDSVTRGQVATVLYRAAGAESTGAGDAERAGRTFSDVDPQAYYAAAVDWCQQQGIVSGYTDAQGDPAGIFGPGDNITREQLAKMIALYAQTMGADIDDAPTETLHGISGWEKASAWSLPYFAWCTDQEIISGYVIDGESWLFPQATATRAQMAKMMMVTMRDVLQLHQ